MGCVQNTMRYQEIFFNALTEILPEPDSKDVKVGIQFLELLNDEETGQQVVYQGD